MRTERGCGGHYCDPSGFELYPDTIPALELLDDAGIPSVILSNHVPELPATISALGLDALVSSVISSGITGYEKPHPEAFRIALGDTPPRNAVMVGDNPIADEQGAVRAGMAALLVRHRVAHHSTVLDAVQTLLAVRCTTDTTAPVVDAVERRRPPDL